MSSEVCPRCGANVSGTLQRAVLTSVREDFCPNCRTRIVARCKKCNALLFFSDPICTLCNTENPMFIKGQKDT